MGTLVACTACVSQFVSLLQIAAWPVQAQQIAVASVPQSLHDSKHEYKHALMLPRHHCWHGRFMVHIGQISHSCEQQHPSCCPTPLPPFVHAGRPNKVPKQTQTQLTAAEGLTHHFAISKQQVFRPTTQALIDSSDAATVQNACWQADLYAPHLPQHSRADPTSTEAACGTPAKCSSPGTGSRPAAASEVARCQQLHKQAGRQAVNSGTCL